MDSAVIVSRVKPNETGENDYLSKPPDLLLALIDKYVNVRLVQGISFNGFVHAIDPLTHSIILSVPREDMFQRTLVPGHAIVDITKIPPLNIRPAIQRVSAAETDPEMSLRKTKLIAWFKWNALPVSEVGTKIVVKSISILPPYKVSDIYANNLFNALQIRKIMESMPQDYVP